MEGEGVLGVFLWWLGGLCEVIVLGMCWLWFCASGCFVSLCSCTVARGRVVGVRVGWLCVCGVFVDCGAFLGVLWWCVLWGDMVYGLWIYMRGKAEICINICMYMHDFIIFAVVS